MPRFFFHVIHDSFSHDEEGMELPDVVHARTQAVRLAGEMLKDLGAEFWQRSDWRLDVCDNVGAVLFILRVSGH